MEIKLVEPKGVATGVIGPMKIFVPLAGIVDIAGEKARLEKEIGKESRIWIRVRENWPTAIFVTKPRRQLLRRKKIN